MSQNGGRMPKITDQEAREYHHLIGKPGKIDTENFSGEGNESVTAGGEIGRPFVFQ